MQSIDWGAVGKQATQANQLRAQQIAAAPPPKAAPAHQAPHINVGPTNRWARLAQVGIGKVNLYNAIQEAKHKQTMDANNSLLKSGAKSINRNLIQPGITSERTVAKGVARILPGGTRDIQANSQAVTQANNAVRQAIADKKAGKISPATANKIIQMSAKNASSASGEQAKTIKSMPSKGQLAAGFAGTAADIVTAGGGKVVRQGAKFTAKEGVQKIVTGKVIKSAALQSSKKAQVGITATGSAVSGVANAKAGGGSGKQALQQGVAGAVLPLLGPAAKLAGKGLKSVTGRVISHGEAKAAKETARNVLDTKSLDDITKTTKAAVQGESKASSVLVKRPNAQKLLPANTKTPVQGPGFTMTSGIDAQKVQLSARLGKINAQLDKVAQGKISMHPDEVKSLVAEKNNIGKIAKGEAKYEDIYPSKQAKVTMPPLPGEKGYPSSHPAQAAEVTPQKEVSTTGSVPKSEATPKEPTKLNDKGNFTPTSAMEKMRARSSNSKLSVNPYIRLTNQGHVAAAREVKQALVEHNQATQQTDAFVKDLKTQMQKDGLTEHDLPKIRESGDTSTKTGKMLADYLDRYGKTASEHNVIEGAKENYFPRHASFESSGQGKAFGLSRKSSNTKNRAQITVADEHGVPTTEDKYKTHEEFVHGVTSQGGKTLSPLQSLQQMSHNLNQNIRNAKLVKALQGTAMTDGKAAVVSGTKKPGNLYEAVDGFPGHFVHKDVAPVIKTLANPTARTGSALVNKVGDVNSGVKHLVTYNALVHGKNFKFADLRNRGIKALIPGTDRYSVADKQRFLEHGGTPFTRNHYQSFVDDMGQKTHRTPIGRAIDKIRDKNDSLLFEKYGNHIGMKTFISAEKELKRINRVTGGKMTPHEISSLAVRSAHDSMMMASPVERSLENRQVSRAAFFAGQFVQNSLQLISKATGFGTDKSLGKAAQHAEQLLAIKRIVRGSAYLFAGAQALNMKTTGHPTWQNDGSKVMPVFYVDKATGKEYHLTNFYGQLGDAFEALTNPGGFASKKVSPVAREVAASLANMDSSGQHVFDKSASGPRQTAQRVVHALGSLLSPAGVSASDVKSNLQGAGKPGAVNAARLLGFGSSSKNYSTMESDIIKRRNDSLPANAPTPQQSQLSILKAKAKNDINKGNKNSANVQQLKGKLTGAAFNKFVKNSGKDDVQTAFEALSPDNKMQILKKYSPQQLKSLDLKTFMTGLAYKKATVDSLHSKGYTDQQIESIIKKTGYNNNQLSQLKDEAKKQASAKAKANRHNPKFVSPFVK